MQVNSELMQVWVAYVGSYDLGARFEAQWHKSVRSIKGASS